MREARPVPASFREKPVHLIKKVSSSGESSPLCRYLNPSPLDARVEDAAYFARFVTCPRCLALGPTDPSADCEWADLIPAMFAWDNANAVKRRIVGEARAYMERGENVPERIVRRLNVYVAVMTNCQKNNAALYAAQQSEASHA